MNTAVGRLVRAELRLMTRDPLVLTFVFAFPVVTMLIIGGAFGTRPDPAFDGVNPSHWYVASYLTVVIAVQQPEQGVLQAGLVDRQVARHLLPAHQGGADEGDRAPVPAHRDPGPGP